MIADGGQYEYPECSPGTDSEACPYKHRHQHHPLRVPRHAVEPARSRPARLRSLEVEEGDHQAHEPQEVESRADEEGRAADAEWGEGDQDEDDTGEHLSQTGQTPLGSSPIRSVVESGDDLPWEASQRGAEYDPVDDQENPTVQPIRPKLRKEDYGSPRFSRATVPQTLVDALA